jgi:hypothetical protein
MTRREDARMTPTRRETEEVTIDKWVDKTGDQRQLEGICS